MKRYLPKRKAWAHQKKGARLIRGKEAFALLMGMRTGKTKIDLDNFGEMELSGDVHDHLVNAPAGAYKTWEGAMDDHLSEDLGKRMRVYTWESGPTKTRIRELDDFMTDHSHPRTLLVNIEAYSTVKMIRDASDAFLLQRKSMHTVDEATTIKNHDAARAKFVVERLALLSDYRRILTGLPTPKSPLDAYMQFNFLDPDILGYSSFYSFRAHHAIMKAVPVGPPMELPNGEMARNPDGSLVRRTVMMPVAYQNEDEIRDSIAPHSYRVKLDDCYDLPPKMYSFRDVAWHPLQKKAYDELKTYATAALNEEDFVTANQVVTLVLRLHQILCGHVVTEDGRVVEVPEYRTESLLDLLEEHDGKCVIWCSYDHDVQKISSAIRKRFDEPVARFWGGNRKTREVEERVFKNDPLCKRMVATPGSGGMARTWDVADLVIYYSNTNNLEHREQSEMRTQLYEKVRSVGYVDMRIPNTVDGKIIDALRKKIDMAATITGDNWREWLV